MSVTTPKDLEVMANLQKAYKSSKNKTSEEISKIFFNYYNLDYKNINNLPHDLKTSLDILQKDGYLNHGPNNLFIRSAKSSNNININNQKYLITLTASGERYFTEKTISFLGKIFDFFNKSKIKF